MDIFILPLIIIAVLNPGHYLDNGRGLYGCQRNPQHLGWQAASRRFGGGQWSRPHCIKDGVTVWCDEYCPARGTLNGFR